MSGIMAPFPTERPTLWIRRSVFGRFGQGIKDTCDTFVSLDDDGTARLFCYGCRDLTIVHMPDPERLEAECCECGHTYEVEVD